MRLFLPDYQLETYGKCYDSFGCLFTDTITLVQPDPIVACYFSDIV